MRRRALFGLGFAALPGLALAQGFSPAQRAEIIEILRNALREDPAILREALGALEQSETAARAEQRRGAIAAQHEALFRDPADPQRGNPRGDVTIVEFFDVRCGFCKQLHPGLEALLARDRNVRVVMKDLPILGPNSVLAARALLAAQRQGRYAPLHNELLTLRGEPTEPVIRQLAERVGLDWTRLRREMDDPAIARRIEGNRRLAQAIGVEGTPALVIAGAAGAPAFVPGAVDLPTLERLVAEARAAR